MTRDTRKSRISVLGIPFPCVLKAEDAGLSSRTLQFIVDQSHIGELPAFWSVPPGKKPFQPIPNDVPTPTAEIDVLFLRRIAS